MNRLTGILAFTLILVSCAKPQGNSRLQEVADINTNADQVAREKVASKMEMDLARLQRFYQGVRGLYEGHVVTPTGKTFRVTFNIHPTVELYEGTRIRTTEEITNDLKVLALDTAEQTFSVLADGSELAFTCSYVDIKPGVDKGFFNLEADRCPRSFQVHIVPDGSDILTDAQELESKSRSVAEALLELRLNKATQLQAEMRTNNISMPMVFTLKRVK